ncbi:MAG: D-glycerate dehydrogenase [Ilumatobacteraceae bacterium]|nr:D-glycerate dehydrogenase [Ilumatobacteraceae bacterium]
MDRGRLMAQPRIVVAGRIPDAGLEVLRPHGNVWGWKHDEPIEINELYERIAGADAVLTLLTTKVDGAFLDAAGPQLKVVSNVAVGYNNIDVALCRQRGVIATNTPDVLTDATADIAMALILMVTRRLGEGERIVRSNKPWQWGMFMLLGTGLQGRRLGIVGMGAIGQALARRANAFGMTVAYSNRRAVSSDIEIELGAERLSLDEMLATSDIISINCPYSTETHHLIGTDQFELMRSSAYLVNTARGPIVDEAALVKALRNGEIAGAGLDVYEHEPQLAAGLTELDNAVLIPHLGSATVETRSAMATLAARNTVAVLSGQPALTPVT